MVLDDEVKFSKFKITKLHGPFPSVQVIRGENTNLMKWYTCLAAVLEIETTDARI
jgi:hypothetical protein